MAQINIYEKPPKKGSAFLVVALLVVAVFAGWAYKNQEKAPVASIISPVVDSIENSLGGLVSALPEQFPNGLTNGDVFERWVKGTIPVGTSSAYWKNTNGRTAFIDFGMMWNPTAASSTLRWTMATSSLVNSFVDYSHTVGVFFDSVEVATGTQIVVDTISSAGLGLQASSSVIAIPDGSYVIFRQEAPTAMCGGAAGSEALNRTCASATSSMGYVAEWKFHYFLR